MCIRDSRWSLLGCGTVAFFAYCRTASRTWTLGCTSRSGACCKAVLRCSSCRCISFGLSLSSGADMRPCMHAVCQARSVGGFLLFQIQHSILVSFHPNLGRLHGVIKRQRAAVQASLLNNLTIVAQPCAKTPAVQVVRRWKRAIIAKGIHLSLIHI